MSPLRAYWWNNSPNFGDALSQLVIAKISGRPVEHASPARAEIFGIGSIMKSVRQGTRSERNDIKPWIWGTGMLSGMNADFMSAIRVAAVRGPLTVSHLGLPPDTPVGDPGLLACDVIDVPPPPREKIGVILHFSQRLPRDLAKRMNKDGRFVRIKAGNDNCREVVNAIASCHHIMSSSLHGLIVADSFRIPSTWLDGTGIHEDPTFKFRDYALSVGRDLGNPVPFDSIFDLASHAARKGTVLPYEEHLQRTTESVRRSFPQELSAVSA